MIFKVGQIVEIPFSKKKNDVGTYEILSFHGENFFETHGSDPKYPDIKKIFRLSDISKIVSEPLPISVGDLVNDGQGKGLVISESKKCINIDKGDVITSHNLSFNKSKLEALRIEEIESELIASRLIEVPLATAKRGGKRDGAGRPATGKKARKALQIDLAIAKKLPDLIQLNSLIDEFRDLAYSTALRSTNLKRFYEALDALKRIA